MHSFSRGYDKGSFEIERGVWEGTLSLQAKYEQLKEDLKRLAA
jgi:hypothetical protein